MADDLPDPPPTLILSPSPSPSRSSPKSFADVKRSTSQEHLPGPVLDPSNVQMIRRIGSGSYGEVFEASYNGQIVAVKVPFKKPQDEEKAFDFLTASRGILGLLEDKQFVQLRHEIQVLTTKRHPCLLMMMGVCLTGDGLWIVTEYCSNRDLLTYFDKKGNSVSQMQICEWRCQVAKGLRWLHSEPCVLHLDLKLDNVFLDINLRAKIGDFGIAAITDSNEGKKEGSTLGNMLHEAPEVIQGLPFGTKADVYGFGILCWEISNVQEWDASLSPSELSGKDMDELQQIFEKGIIDGTRRPKHQPCFPTFSRFLDKCWSVNPADRPTFQEIVPELMRETVPAILTVDRAAEFWSSKFGDVMKISFGAFLSALTKSNLVNSKDFFTKKAKLALRRLLQVESDSSPVSIDVFGRFSRAFLCYSDLSPSVLVTVFQSDAFDPFATEEDVYSHLEGSPDGTGIITYAPNERYKQNVAVALHTLIGGDVKNDRIMFNPVNGELQNEHSGRVYKGIVDLCKSVAKANRTLEEEEC